MRKLKLQVQITVDGFIAGPNGELDWMWINGGRDEAMFQKVIDLAAACDTIVMGRKMNPGFTNYWENVVDNQPDSPEQPLAKLMVDIPKIIFSRTQSSTNGRNIKVENSDLATAINALKKQPGKDIMAYGGADFLTSLISLNLVDEYYFFRNPVAIGSGLTIFKERKILKLQSAITYANGKVLETYLPA